MLCVRRQLWQPRQPGPRALRGRVLSIPREGTGEDNGSRVEEGGVVVLGAEVGVYVDEGTGEGVVCVLVCAGGHVLVSLCAWARVGVQARLQVRV